MIFRNRTLSQLTVGVLGLSLSTLVSAFDVAGLQLGDPIEKFETLESPAKDFLTITPDSEGRIVRILYQQEGLANDAETQAKLVNRICGKYGRVTPCLTALTEIQSDDRKFLRFFHLYRSDDRTQELRARIRRTKAFSLIPDLTVEIDLIDTNFSRTLRQQNENASKLIDF